MKRKPAVAGMFYPDNSAELQRMVDEFIGRAEADSTIPKAVISPHAGYVYSGRVAGAAYAYLKNGRSRYTRLVLLGPSHRVPLEGLALSSADSFQTPLGDVPVDADGARSIAGFPFVSLADEAHEHEHSLEVQLPFIQRSLPEAKIVPLVVGRIHPDNLCAALEELAAGDETAVIVSSDLSHYLDYAAAKRTDNETSRTIERLDGEHIRSNQACGVYPIKGLLAFAVKHQLSGRTVEQINSGDTAGSTDRVVGYGAYIFS